jgi:hypothetical protein
MKFPDSLTTEEMRTYLKEQIIANDLKIVQLVDSEHNPKQVILDATDSKDIWPGGIVAWYIYDQLMDRWIACQTVDTSGKRTYYKLLDGRRITDVGPEVFDESPGRPMLWHRPKEVCRADEVPEDPE